MTFRQRRISHSKVLSFFCTFPSRPRSDSRTIPKRRGKKSKGGDETVVDTRFSLGQRPRQSVLRRHRRPNGLFLSLSLLPFLCSFVLSAASPTDCSTARRKLALVVSLPSHHETANELVTVTTTYHATYLTYLYYLFTRCRRRWLSALVPARVCVRARSRDGLNICNGNQGHPGISKPQRALSCVKALTLVTPPSSSSRRGS